MAPKKKGVKMDFGSFYNDPCMLYMYYIGHRRLFFIRFSHNLAAEFIIKLIAGNAAITLQLVSSDCKRLPTAFYQ